MLISEIQAKMFLKIAGCHGWCMLYSFKFSICYSFLFGFIIILLLFLDKPRF